MNAHTTHQQVALITEANKDIGRAAAEQLAALGMTVLVGARNTRRREDAATALRAAAGGDAHAITLEVTDSTTIQEAVKPVEELRGRLDVLIATPTSPGSGQVSPEDPAIRSRAPSTWTWCERCPGPTPSGWSR